MLFISICSAKTSNHIPYANHPPRVADISRRYITIRIFNPGEPFRTRIKSVKRMGGHCECLLTDPICRLEGLWKEGCVGKKRFKTLNLVEY